MLNNKLKKVRDASRKAGRAQLSRNWSWPKGGREGETSNCRPGNGSLGPTLPVVAIGCFTYEYDPVSRQLPYPAAHLNDAVRLPCCRCPQRRCYVPLTVWRLLTPTAALAFFRRMSAINVSPTATATATETFEHRVVFLCSFGPSHRKLLDLLSI